MAWAGRRSFMVRLTDSGDNGGSDVGLEKKEKDKGDLDDFGL